MMLSKPFIILVEIFCCTMDIYEKFSCFILLSSSLSQLLSQKRATVSFKTARRPATFKSNTYSFIDALHQPRRVERSKEIYLLIL